MELYAEPGQRICPVMISGTITDQAGRTLSGQTVEAFIASMSHAPHLLTLGLNCALGPELMLPYVQRMSAATPHFVMAYPNNGLPNELGEYPQTPAQFREKLAAFTENRLVNIVGGCCGYASELSLVSIVIWLVSSYVWSCRLIRLRPCRTTPSHIAALVEHFAHVPPRVPPAPYDNLVLSG